MSGLGFDFDFRPRSIDGDAGEIVEQIWYARGTVPYRRELIAPTGAAVAVLILGDPIRAGTADGHSVVSDRGIVVGPHVEPVENEPLGETFALGVITTPTGCDAAFQVAPTDVCGRVVPLDDTGSRLTLVRDRLAAAASAGTSAVDLLDTLETEVRGWHDDHGDREPGARRRIADAVSLLESEPRRPIRDIAVAVGLSHEHLDREFSRIVGVAPRALARLLLLRRIIADLDPLDPPPWAQLATEGGWSDQAHFSRDFRRHTGVTPSHYLAVQRAFALDGNEGRGFTPDLDGLR